MKFNILPGRGVFWNWVYKYTYDGKIYKNKLYTLHQSALPLRSCSTTVQVLWAAPLTNAHFPFLKFPEVQICQAFLRTANYPEIQNHRIHQKSRITKSYSNPESSSPWRIPGSSNLLEIKFPPIYQKTRASNLPEIHSLQIYQKSRVFKSTRNPESSNQPELLNQWLIFTGLILV